MTNSLPRTTLHESFASTSELANLHIHKLDGAGRTVEPHIYAQEGHGFLKRENRIDARTGIVPWFGTHLK